MNLFSCSNSNEEEIRNGAFIKYSDLEKYVSDSHLKILLGSKKINNVETVFVCVDFSSFSEKKINCIFKSFGIFLNLRNISPILDDFTGSLMAYSVAISNWHKNNRFCGKCGKVTKVSKAGHQINCQDKDCLFCNFPRTDPAVIMLVYHKNKTLLGRQKIWPKGMYSTLAGFVEPGETIENSVAREVFEESGISVKNIQYHSSQPWPFPSSLMLGFNAEAKSTKITIDKNEIEDVQWFSKKEITDFHNQKKFLPRKISIARRLIDDWMKC